MEPPSARFLVTRPIPTPGLELLAAAGEVTLCKQPPAYDELAAACSSGKYQVVITQLTDRIDATLLAAARIQGVSNYAAGTDNIDIEAAARFSIQVANTPDVLTDATADIAILLMIATARRCIEADAFLRAGHFTGWEPNLLLGTDMSGTRLGLVGFGRIARATARRALGFGMTIQFAMIGQHQRQVPTSEVGELADYAEQVPFEQLLATSDFISLHVPLSTDTRHLIDRRAFSAMKSTAILVNTARGAIIDEAALIAALQSHQLAGVGLDVYEFEPTVSPALRSNPRTTLLPHIGSATTRVRSDMARLCALNAIAISQNKFPVL